MTKYNFFIPGRLPGMNEIIKEARGNKYASAHEKKVNTVRVYNAIRLVFHGYKTMGKVWLSCNWVEKNKKRDPDNIVVAKKYICDGLVLAGLLKNDGWSQIAGFTDTWEVGEPGVWVEVREV